MNWQSKTLRVKSILFFGLMISVLFAQTEAITAQTTNVKNDPANAPVIPGLIVNSNTKIKNLTNETYWRAARTGDLETIKSAIKSGIEVDAKTEYGATALFYACDREHEAIAKFLLEKGADPNSKDTFYNATPISWSKNKKITAMLLANGGEGGDQQLMQAITSGDHEFAKLIVDSESVSNEGLVKSRGVALQRENDDVKPKLIAVFEGLDLPAPTAPIDLTPEVLKRYEGHFKSDRFTAKFSPGEKNLQVSFDGGAKTDLIYVGENEFLFNGASLVFEMDGDTVKLARLDSNGLEFVLTPIPVAESDLPPKPNVAETKPTATSEPSANGETAKPELAATEPEEEELGPSDINSLWTDLSISSANWPGFRGNGARGVAEGQNPPTKWNVVAENAVEEKLTDGESADDETKSDESEIEDATNVNLKWKSPVPGLGLSCPSIWGDRIYVTSAVSDDDGGELKIGLYGDVDSVEEDKEYDFNVFCFNKYDGSLIWEKTAHTAKPAVKRHAKSSHANPTIATNGQHVIAFFGSEGLYCYSTDGELNWKVDLGMLDSGWFYDPGYQWGFASSSVIYKDHVIVQCDIQGQSFIAAYDLATGTEVWRTERDEIPTWSTPTVHDFGDPEKKWDRRPMLITNGTKAARGYDLKNGKQLWQVNDNSEIVVPTPFVAHGLIYVSSGYSPIQPIYAIRPEARGDISPGENNTTNESIPWSVKRGGPYMPTPIVYGDYLYSCANNGILTCYVAKTGKEVYKKRVRVSGGGLSFTASPVAGDGHVYLTAEDGRVVVVKAGPEFEVVRTNHCNESILATPAISDGVMYFRTQNNLIAVGE